MVIADRAGLTLKRDLSYSPNPPFEQITSRSCFQFMEQVPKQRPSHLIPERQPQRILLQADKVIPCRPDTPRVPPPLTPLIIQPRQSRHPGEHF